MLRLRKISEVYGMKVYTDEGDYFGIIEEPLISGNKIYGWKIKINDPELIKRGIRGIIIQHQLVKAIGDIMIVSKAALSIKEELEKGVQEEKELKAKK